MFSSELCTRVYNQPCIPPTSSFVKEIRAIPNHSFSMTMLHSSCRLVVSSCRLQRRWFASSSNTPPISNLILIRHGQSIWNATPTFTGWCDVPLTDQGMAQAKACGYLLHQRGYNRLDHVFTSQLKRAYITAQLVMTFMPPFRMDPSNYHTAWQLNERHYGALQGIRKDDPDLIHKYGLEQVVEWRRSLTARPPPYDETHPYWQPPPAPTTESLHDCQVRVVNYFYSNIHPLLCQGKSSTILIVAHSNTIRALIAELDQKREEDIPSLHIPNSVPCLYQWNAETGEMIRDSHDDNVCNATWIWSSENYQRLQEKLGQDSHAYLQGLFAAWDQDGDGLLSRREVEQGLASLRGDQDVAVAAIAGKMYQEMDKSTGLSAADANDNYVSLDELKAYVQTGGQALNLPFLTGHEYDSVEEELQDLFDPVAASG